MEQPKIPKEYFINIESLYEGINELEYTIDSSYMDIEGLQKDIEIQLRITKIIKKIIVKGKIIFKLELECARCLEKFITNFIEDVNSVFLPEAVVGVRLDEEVEDPEVNFYTGKTINLLPLLRDTVILSIPIKPVCSSLCKGLCPVCGKNLNEEDCKCSR